MLSLGERDDMKVLWFCNCRLSDSDAGGTGSWLDAMARGLLASRSVELGIIVSGPVKQVTRSDYRQVKQWLVPGRIRFGRDGLPQNTLVNSIVAAVNEFSPDLVHVWGTESWWGLLTARGLLTYPTLLEMQGIKGQIAKVFYGGLTLPEQIHCIGVKELLKRRTMHSDRRVFARWGAYEEEIIRGHQCIDVQSAWVSAQVKAIQPKAHMFSVELALRQPFYDHDGWQSSCSSTIFCTAAYTSPFKGLHVAIRALALLRKRIPEARLRIAGAHQRPGIRQEGYMRWINRMIRHLDLDHAVDWMGPLSADQIVAEMKNAGAMVIPTFIENCCTAMQEAMSIGIPVVVSYAGGIPSLAKDEDSCLFFPPGDEAMCAYQLERVLTDKELALRISLESRKIATVRNDRARIVQRQLEIYRQVVEEGK
jgi:glycosyltransferase involved in cell wall biosynthesis